MGRPTQVTVNQSGQASEWIPLDRHISPFNIAFACVVSGGSDYRVQHTLNNVIAGSAATAFNHVDVSAATTNRDGNYAFPISAIRVQMTSGHGKVEMTVIQAGVD